VCHFILEGEADVGRLSCPRCEEVLFTLSPAGTRVATEELYFLKMDVGARLKQLYSSPALATQMQWWEKKVKAKYCHAPDDEVELARWNRDQKVSLCAQYHGQS
jgi:hypothetical protein